MGGSWGGVASGESGTGITIVTRDIWKKGFKGT